MKDVKIIIGNNYGSEGKGLITRYFTQITENPIVILYNGTVQRGHTVNYTPSDSHIYRHFGSGTRDDVPTFFASTFLVHPMEYANEYQELIEYVKPEVYCDPDCYVITPFDMLVDQITKAWNKKHNNVMTYDTCGWGSWCVVEDRIPAGRTAYTVSDFKKSDVEVLMNNIWDDCLHILEDRGVDMEQLPELQEMLTEKAKQNAINHFTKDLKVFFDTVKLITFDKIWRKYISPIFEGGQGLGLDMDVDNQWHTTSKTGVTIPYNMIKNKRNFRAEVCYVTRTYLTRHGDGPLENELSSSKELNTNIIDSTNIYNSFQGKFRYGLIDNNMREARLQADFDQVKKDKRFFKTLAITHCNEYSANFIGDYYSDHRMRVRKPKRNS